MSGMKTAKELTEPGYYWWLPDCNKNEPSNPDNWTIRLWHPKDVSRPQSGYFIGPIRLEQSTELTALRARVAELEAELAKYRRAVAKEALIVHCGGHAEFTMHNLSRKKFKVGTHVTVLILPKEGVT